MPKQVMDRWVIITHMLPAKGLQTRNNQSIISFRSHAESNLLQPTGVDLQIFTDKF